MRGSSAYTLIEVLVAMSIIGIIFTVGYVGFREFSRRQSLAGAVKQIKGDLRLAQSFALSGKKPIHANCDSPNVLNGYEFIASPNPGDDYAIRAICSGGTVSYKDVSLPPEISIDPFPQVFFKILGQGTGIGSGSTIVLTLRQGGTNATANVTITAGGEVK